MSLNTELKFRWGCTKTSCSNGVESPSSLCRADGLIEFCCRENMVNKSLKEQGGMSTDDSALLCVFIYVHVYFSFVRAQMINEAA